MVSDAEIHDLRNRLEKLKLERKISALEKPFPFAADKKSEKKTDNLKKAIDRLAFKVLLLWKASPDHESDVQHCVYCGEEVKYYEKGGEGWFVCSGCNWVFRQP